MVPLHGLDDDSAGERRTRAAGLRQLLPQGVTRSDATREHSGLEAGEDADEPEENVGKDGGRSPAGWRASTSNLVAHTAVRMCDTLCEPCPRT